MQRIANVLGMALSSLLLCGWSGQQVKSDELTVLIEEVETVSAYDQPTPVRIVLESRAAATLSGAVEIRGLVDETRIVGSARKAFSLPARGKTQLEFAIAFGPGAHSALYPVHAYVEFTHDGKKETLHAVRIVETRFPKVAALAPKTLPLNVVPARGGLPLWTLRTQRVAWKRYDGELNFKPVGWAGSDSASGASLSFGTHVRGASKSALQMHPPWTGGGGTVFCDYLLKLPDTQPLRLTFANAIRDHSAQEPPSDGVLFRVWALPDAGRGTPEIIFENFTAAKTWTPGAADLSRFAGQTILLRLESHPGPNKNTTCDSSYWAEPLLLSGPPVKADQTDFTAAAKRGETLGRALLRGDAKPDRATTFLMGEGATATAAVFQPSARGLIDGTLTLVGARSTVTFSGFDIQVLDQPALRQPTGIAFLDYAVWREAGRTRHVHQLELNGEPFELTLTLRPERDGLQIAFSSDKRITDFALGVTDREARSVYYGHGYRIDEPQAFRAGFGGHNLSTSHVGFDFDGGLSLLQAFDTVPDNLQVAPSEKHYSLHTHLNGTMTLVAGERGAFDCAIRYRPLYDKQAAPGVERLAGRFGFDIWGGRYADIATRMEEAIRYGLTDSFLTLHVWQRWGYDYRLPDIWPPQPELGTTEELRRVGDICRAADIPWGLHDNYIDFYPDAEGYSYDHIAFSRDGQPIRAWNNQWRGAQSYRWRPDRFMPFLKRNLKLIKEGVAPTHYFIDVFTSIGCFDFYDRDGKFHPITETRKYWGESFAWIRDYLGGAAPTTSEAGHDQLTGWLDGADCQFLQIVDQPQRFCQTIQCEKWARVPWFDAVNHHRFILHGVGYSTRYQGDRGRTEHGINSDDYISAEILTGHDLMVDAGSWGRSAVRKYWLAQNVARNLALRKIANVEFAGGDIHRQAITWDNGTKVRVNRGETDWQVEGRVLPQYGYLVKGAGGLESVIEKRGGIFCESGTDGKATWYCNARTHDPALALPIRVRAENFKHLGGRKFQWDIVWQADRPTPRDTIAFMHFYGKEAARDDKIVFQDDHAPSPPTSKWRGEIRYTRTVTVPENADGQYQAGIGLWEQGGARLRLAGREIPKVDGRAYWLGALEVKRTAGKISQITLTPPPPETLPPTRMNPTGKSIDFGWCVTDGAFRLLKTKDGLRLIPLPESPPFDITLQLPILGASQPIKSITARDINEKTIGGAVEFKLDQGQLKFRHDGKAFCYDLRTR